MSRQPEGTTPSGEAGGNWGATKGPTADVPGGALGGTRRNPCFAAVTITPGKGNRYFTHWLLLNILIQAKTSELYFTSQALKNDIGQTYCTTLNHVTGGVYYRKRACERGIHTPYTPRQKYP